MPISRMQQPRQMYGLGSLVKSVAKPIKSVVKGIGNLAKSDFGKLALTAGGLYGLNKFGLGPIKSGFLGNLLPSSDLFTGKNFLKAAAITVPSVLAAAGVEEEEVEELQQDKDKLAVLLDRGYRNLNPGISDDQVAAFVRANLAGGGSPEENAIQASGIMGLPLNENPAGVTELDLRETGGFIPPVGVKEKADDIPAMLSNNEFVFTADAVRGMGDGDVNKGAERMYSMMKTLENGGRV